MTGNLRLIAAFALVLAGGFAMTREVIKIGPQPGPQTQVMSTRADIAIYGGAAGGGKSYALLLEPVRHFNNPKFGGVIFRRNATQIRNEGGLWDESVGLYGLLGARPREHLLDWKFPAGGKQGFDHLELERTVLNHQGAQIPFIGFDELTHFTEKQFWYMLSRNRSTSGIPGYVRATCNPDADSWVAKLIDWWIGEDGYPIPERAGVLRWFVRIDDRLEWGDSREELIRRLGKKVLPKSLTFIPSSIHDNQILMEKDPSYLANLNALSRVDRLRLLGGNWKIRASAGTVFRREWFKVVDAVPAGLRATIRFWDRAASEVSPENPDPDWTRGVKMGQLEDGRYIILDVRSARTTAGQVEKMICNVASQDGHNCVVMAQQDPGSAGKGEAEWFVRMLAGYYAKTATFTGDKLTRAKPLSAQAEAGNVLLLRGEWNDDFLDEHEKFDGSGKGHDDQVDGASGGFNELALNAPGRFAPNASKPTGTMAGGVSKKGW